jgi:hypothetical protein
MMMASKGFVEDRIEIITKIVNETIDKIRKEILPVKN